MSILREWRAEIRRATSAAYVEYVRATGIAEYRRTPGNLEAVVAVRDIDETRSEIVTLSWCPVPAHPARLRPALPVLGYRVARFTGLP